MADCFNWLQFLSQEDSQPMYANHEEAKQAFKDLLKDKVHTNSCHKLQ